MPATAAVRSPTRAAPPASPRPPSALSRPHHVFAKATDAISALGQAARANVSSHAAAW
jgi:hypothetical protein